MSEPSAAFSTPWADGAEEPLEPISAADLATLNAARATPGPYTLGPDSTAQEGLPLCAGRRRPLAGARWRDLPRDDALALA
jgi:hypothetical protein